MKDTGFFAPPDKRGAPGDAVPADARRHARAHAESERRSAAPRYFAGSGGMVSTAEDYAQFAQMMLNGGELNGRRYLGPRTVQLMITNHTGDMVNGQFGRPAARHGLRPGRAGQRGPGARRACRSRRARGAGRAASAPTSTSSRPSRWSRSSSCRRRTARCSATSRTPIFGRRSSTDDEREAPHVAAARALIKLGLAAAGGAARRRSRSAGRRPRRRARPPWSRAAASGAGCRAAPGPDRTTLEELTLRPHRRPPGAGAHRGHQPLLLERRRRARPAAESRPARRPAAAAHLQPPRPAPRRRRRRGGGPRPSRRDGAHPGPRRRRRRRGRGPRGAARAGGRPRVRVGHAAVRRLLPVPARPQPTCASSSAARAPTIWWRWPTCATARRSTPTRTSAAWPS